MQPVVAVFVSPDFLDMGRLRVWAREVRSQAPGTVALLTDDPSEANTVLARQLRCEGVVHGIVRTPTTLRSREQLETARRDRDTAMIELADAVVTFGVVDEQLFACKTVTRY